MKQLHVFPHSLFPTKWLLWGRGFATVKTGGDASGSNISGSSSDGWVVGLTCLYLMNVNDVLALESVIATAELQRRGTRVADVKREDEANTALMKELTKDPQAFFQKLVEAVLALSRADSAGISLLDEEKGKFIWPAVAGRLSCYLGAGTPRDFGPCGTVLDRNAAVLFQHPERHFLYLTPITPSLEEVLLIPFHMEEKPVGTIWAVIHEVDKKFDAEDQRLLESMSAFAASAYRLLVMAELLTPLIRTVAR
ncbi:MAG: GAF domain-containing protein [Candidatus Methylacidiphilales bacterium]